VNVIEGGQFVAMETILAIGDGVKKDSGGGQ
jgi:hypothetical protein